MTKREWGLHRAWCTALIVVLLAVSSDAHRVKTGKVFEHPLMRRIQAANFQTEVLNPTVPILLLLFPSTDGSAQAIFDVMTAVAEAFDPFAEFRVVDVSTEDGRNMAQQFGVAPQLGLMMFNPDLTPVDGSDSHFMKMPVSFQGELSVSGISKWILSTITINHVERVTDEHDMADFIAKYSSLDMPKIALVSRERSISPLFLYASHKYRYGAVFGLIDANATDVLQRYHIETVPTVMVLVPRRDLHDDVYFMTNVTAGTTPADFERFVAQYALPESQRDLRRQQIFIEEHKLRVKEAEQAKYSNILHPVVVTSQKQWVRNCLSLKKGNCFVVFLEGTGDSATLPIEMLVNVTRKTALKSQVPLQVVFVDGTANYKMLNFFGIANGMPDAVFLQPQRKTVVNLVGSFSERGLTAFLLDKALKGIGSRPYKAKKVPKFRKSPETDGEVVDSDEL
jgi:hypothetical protein